jgi:hypothetical protein
VQREAVKAKVKFKPTAGHAVVSKYTPKRDSVIALPAYMSDNKGLWFVNAINDPSLTIKAGDIVVLAGSYAAAEADGFYFVETKAIMAVRS